MSSGTLPTSEDVLNAARRLHGHVLRTPVLRNDALDEMAGAKLWFKCENLQITGSFKIRGATNRLLQLSPEEREKGVVAFSSGNHAQGVARAAKNFRMPALIVMPSDAPAIKVEGVRRDGAEIRLYDRDSESREEIAAEETDKRGATLVPSFDDPYIIAGQGSAGVEFGQQMRDANTLLDHIICCAGGGGLITGLALGYRHFDPDIAIWTAEPEAHDDWRRSLVADQIEVNAPGTRSICDAILTPSPGDLTWMLGRDLLAGGCAVGDDKIEEAMRLAFRHLKLVVEPGGAAALACALFDLPDAAKGKSVGVVLSGGNVDPAQYARILAG
ncbi:MAG TPA: threonine/serine dehydratase [Henriciella marina]|uniref:threonine ammonia-lyase n=1 Tax=Henriciella sp. TaxID=1968823 RepID=UPI001810B455|nr:threonine/serine dehydratase [Henriciella sp.]HIG21299.1 threonine/serine dehydratase [Henriciella sp.]HIK64484.1 threonine/serine dehydratase [Henriciella marina]